MPEQSELLCCTAPASVFNDGGAINKSDTVDSSPRDMALVLVRY